MTQPIDPSNQSKGAPAGSTPPGAPAATPKVVAVQPKPGAKTEGAKPSPLFAPTPVVNLLVGKPTDTKAVPPGKPGAFLPRAPTRATNDPPTQPPGGGAAARLASSKVTVLGGHGVGDTQHGNAFHPPAEAAAVPPLDDEHHALLDEFFREGEGADHLHDHASVAQPQRKNVAQIVDPFAVSGGAGIAAPDLRPAALRHHPDLPSVMVDPQHGSAPSHPPAGAPFQAFQPERQGVAPEQQDPPSRWPTGGGRGWNNDPPTVTYPPGEVIRGDSDDKLFAKIFLGLFLGLIFLAIAAAVLYYVGPRVMTWGREHNPFRTRPPVVAPVTPAQPPAPAPTPAPPTVTPVPGTLVEPMAHCTTTATMGNGQVDQGAVSHCCLVAPRAIQAADSNVSGVWVRVSGQDPVTSYGGGLANVCLRSNAPRVRWRQ